jgi:4-hydroxy-tetrahydrodipicolinate synthase
VIDGQPVAEKDFDRFNRDVEAYNQVADRVMDAYGVAVNDLHRAIVAAGVADCVSADGVHMTDQGYAILTRHVAAAIRRAIAADRGDSLNKEVSMEATTEPLAAKRGAGIVVPMVTPFTPTGDLDEPAVRRVVDHLLAGGVDGIFVLGTTGEDASMPAPMRAQLIAVTVDQVDRRATTYAGISHNCLAESVAAADQYRQLGIDVLVARLPTYFALSGEEQHAYFQALLEQIPGPLMLYNISSTTHMAIPIPVVEALSQHPKVVGLKDSDADLPRLEELVRRLGRRPDFSLLCGVTAWSARALALGADGCVPSTANLVPEVCQRLYENFCQGDLAAAEACQRELDALGSFLRAGQSLAQSIGSLKAAMGALGLCGPAVLPPLCTPSPAQQEAVRSAFRRWQAERDRRL